MNTSSTTAATPAPLWFRAFSGIYDLFPLLALWFFATVIALAVRGGDLDVHRLPDKLLEQALLLIFTGAYFVISWTRGGQTIGMKPWRLRVVCANGSPIDAKRATIRFLLALISLAVLGLGFLWALFDPQRRAWHDVAAGTLLVRLEKAPSPS